MESYSFIKKVCEEKYAGQSVTAIAPHILSFGKVTAGNLNILGANTIAYYGTIHYCIGFTTGGPETFEAWIYKDHNNAGTVLHALTQVTDLDGYGNSNIVIPGILFKSIKHLAYPFVVSLHFVGYKITLAP